MIKNGLKHWKCMESTFFSLTPPQKKYVLYINLNVDNYGTLPYNILSSLYTSPQFCDNVLETYIILIIFSVNIWVN